MAAVADGKPTGKYADRMLAGAWPESTPADLYAEQLRWREMRNRARDQFHELRDNGTQLRQALDSDGFDKLHRDRELVARNFDFLAETRDDASRIWEHAGDSAGTLRKSMASTVRIVEQEISTIESNPLLDDAEKQALIESLVEATNSELIGQSASAAAALAGEVAKHIGYMSSLPWHMSAANAAPFTGTSNGNGVQMLGTGWKQDPVLPNETGNGTSTGDSPGTGGQRPGEQQTPGQATDGQPGATTERPGATQKPGTDSGGTGPSARPPSGEPKPGVTQAPGTSPAAPGTGGGVPPGATQKPSTPFSLPPIASPAGSGGGLGGSPGGGLGAGGLGAGGLQPGGFAQPLMPSQLAGATTPPVSAANPLSSAAAPAASGLGSGGGAASPTSVPVPTQVAPSTPAQAVPAAPPTPAASPSVQPAGMTSATPPPIASAGAPPVAAGPLGPAPPLAGPNTPPAPMAPAAPAVPPPGVGAPPGPFHSPLPPVGAPLVRSGLVERAEDPDIVRARSLIWELMWAGRRYPSLDWAIGLHKASGETGPTKFFIASSEGEGYIPQHVYLPVDPVLVTLFQDADFVRRGWRQQWQGWVDPARIVVEHHRLRQEAFGRPVLNAIVSSREISGLAHILPAGVSLEVAAAHKNPFVDPGKAREIPEIEPGRAHRLEILDRELYALVQRLPEGERWSAGVDLAADAASATDERHVRQGLVARDMPALPSMDPGAGVLHSVIDQLRMPGGAVPPEGWAQMQTAYWTQVTQAQGKRHTPQDFTDDTGYVDAYRRARAFEATWLLNAPAGPLSASWLADVAYAHLCATDDPNRTGKSLVARA